MLKTVNDFLSAIYVSLEHLFVAIAFFSIREYNPVKCIWVIFSQ